MFTTLEANFIELKLDIKEAIFKAESKLNHVNISLRSIGLHETLMLVKDELRGINFNLSVPNDVVLKEECLSKIVINELLSRTEKMYIKGVK